MRYGMKTNSLMVFVPNKDTYQLWHLTSLIKAYTEHIYSLPASSNVCSLLKTFANCLDPYHA